MFTVFYRKASYNPSKSYFQNQNRFVGSRGFKTEAEAREFAKSVDVKYIVNPSGHKI